MSSLQFMKGTVPVALGEKLLTTKFGGFTK